MKQDGQGVTQLSQQELEWADFVENAAVGLHWVAADGTILWANQAELDLLGYSREEYIGHPIAEFHAARLVCEDILQRLTAGEQLVNYEAQMRCKDGSLKDVLISSNVRFVHGEFRHTRCVTIDVTAQKQAENQLRALYELSTALSEALTPRQVAHIIVEQGIKRLDASAGTVVLLNSTQTELEITGAFGYPAQSLQDWQSFPVDSPVPLAECVQTQQPIWLRDVAEYQSRYPGATLLYPSTSAYQAWAAVPLQIDQQVIGALGLSFVMPRTFHESECHFIMALAHQCAQALERSRLAEQARDQAVLEERQRLARDLHDSVSQSLFSIASLAQILPRLVAKDPEQAQQQLQQLELMSQAAIAEMRSLLLELRPAGLLKLSLPALLTQLVTAVQARSELELQVRVEVERPLPENVHIAIYRIAQEAINNMVKHSDATAGSITCLAEAGQLTLRISDNGRGMNTALPSAGLGWGIMRERAESIGGSITMISQVGTGTEIFVTCPLNATGSPQGSG